MRKDRSSSVRDALEYAQLGCKCWRFCPVNRTYLITPSSPTVEYKGVKIWLWDADAVETWNAAPDACARRAQEAGLLPQLKKQ